MADTPTTGVQTHIAITHDNIVEKLCFLRFGEDFNENQGKFKEDLYTFRREKAKTLISRQAIMFWFEQRESKPTSEQAIRFLHRYFDDAIARYALQKADQKKVYKQVIAFFKRNDTSANGFNERQSSEFALSHNRRIMIDVPQSWEKMRELSEQLIGFYQILHMRVDDDQQEEPIASELLEIYYSGGELRFRLTYPMGKREKAMINGIVFSVGPTVWLAGSNDTAKPRMRVLALRDLGGEETRYNVLRWGILTTDIPKPSSPDPVSCQFVMWRIDRQVKNRNEYVQKFVRHIGKEEAKKEPLKSLMRVIMNNISALSDGHSSEPPLRAGNPIVDEPLKVNQLTIELLADRIAGFLTAY